jgi:hypothetical protein
MGRLVGRIPEDSHMILHGLIQQACSLELVSPNQQWDLILSAGPSFEAVALGEVVDGTLGLWCFNLLGYITIPK